MKKLLLLLVSGLVVGGCSFTRDTPAPVVNVTAPARPAVNPAAVAKPQVATAKPAQATAPSTTINKIDQDEDGAIVQNSTKPAPKQQEAASSAVAAPGKLIDVAGVEWQMPTSGKIIQPYSAAAKGIDVAGKEGQPIVAAAEGKVVYSGSGLKGYGNLIIIKHKNNYLTAYSHNKQNLVKEGDSVKQGQKIALLGKTDSDKPILHFELRKNGKPINPTAIFSN